MEKSSSETLTKPPHKVMHTVDSFALLMGVDSKVIERMIGRGWLTVELVNGQRFLPAKTAANEYNAARLKLAKETPQKKHGPDAPKSKVAAHESIFDAETKDKIFKSKLTELKYLEQSGKLVDAGEVDRRAFERGRKTRDAILLLPSRFAAELAVITDPHELEVFLTRELVKALDKITSEEFDQLNKKAEVSSETTTQKET